MERINKKTKEQTNNSVKRAKIKAKERAKYIKEEFNKALNTALIAAFGFLIALVWRDVIQEWVNKISESSPVQGKLISALIVTIICVLGIIVVARVFKVNKE